MSRILLISLWVITVPHNGSLSIHTHSLLSQGTGSGSLFCSQIHCFVDIEPGTDILTRYWHTKKDAWYNIFVYQCCACTNHTKQAPDPLPTVDTTTLGNTLHISDHPLRAREDPVADTCESKQVLDGLQSHVSDFLEFAQERVVGLSLCRERDN